MRNKYSREILDRIARLRQNGLSFRQVSELVGLSESRVSSICRRSKIKILTFKEIQQNSINAMTIKPEEGKQKPSSKYEAILNENINPGKSYAELLRERGLKVNNEGYAYKKRTRIKS